MTDLTDNARQEIAHLTRHAADTRLDPAERAAALLTAHQRWDVGGCLCGWAELGMSHALHQADALADAGLLAAADHHARLAAGTETQTRPPAKVQCPTWGCRAGRGHEGDCNVRAAGTED